MPIDLSKTSTPFDPGAVIPSGTTAPMQISSSQAAMARTGCLLAAETRRAGAPTSSRVRHHRGPAQRPKALEALDCRGRRPRRRRRDHLDLLGSLARSAYNFSATDTGAEVDAKLKNFDYGDAQQAAGHRQNWSRARRTQPDDRREVSRPQHRRRRRHQGHEGMGAMGRGRPGP